MKLTVERKPFSDLLKQAASVAKGIGMLANVKLSCSDLGLLNLEATSASEACHLSMAATGYLEGGELLVEAERLSAFVALDSAESLTLSHAKGRLTVEGRSKVTLSTLPVDGFPSLPDPAGVKDWLTLPQECLPMAFPRPLSLASDKMLHGCTSGLLSASGGLVRAYGNSASLVYRAGSVCEAPEGLELALVIPKEAGRRIGGAAGPIRVGQAAGWLFAELEGGDWAFRQPEETHPAYESLPIWKEERQPEAMLSPEQAKELMSGIKAMASVSELGHFWVARERLGVMVQGDVQSGEWNMEGVDTSESDIRWFGSLKLLAKGLSAVAEEGLGFELHASKNDGVRARNALDEQVWIGGMKR
jgi:hypothetical protein